MPTWQEEAERISRLVDPQYMTPTKARHIGSLWTKLRPIHVLEIGTFKGTGACYLGAMAATFGGRVTTVDLPWTATHNTKLNVLAEEQLAKCGVGNVTVVRREDGAEGFLLDHLRQKKPLFDFVYIDGGHCWLHTSSQFVLAMATLRVGGWVCFDDLHNEAWPEVQCTWDHVVKPLTARRYETAAMLGFAMRSSPLL